jgi:7-keto-8-aminopelargonate synthetase-like enzyme
MGTFSKSFASLGGFVVGDADVLYFIKHKARSLMFSASISPANAAAALAALDLIENEPERRERLWSITRRMQSEFAAMGFDTAGSETPIIPVVIGDRDTTFRFWNALFQAGIFTNAITAPAVPEGMSLIRTSYTASHTDAEMDRVLEVFEKTGRSFGLIG